MDTGERGKLQQSQSFPAQQAERRFGLSADWIPCITGTVRERVYRCGNKERIRFGDGFAQKIDQCVVNTGVANAALCEKKLHGIWL